VGFIRLNKTQIIDGLGEAHSFPLHGLSTALPFATAQAPEKFAGATVQINYPVKFLSKNFPAAESGVILNELIIAHAAPESGPAGDANRLPSEEKVVEEAALVLS